MDRSMIDAASGGVLVNKTPTQVKTYGICFNMGHSTDICSILQEEPVEQANAVGGFPGMPQRRYDPYAQTYNPGWKDHPNFSYGVRPLGFPQQYPPRQLAPPQSNSKSACNYNKHSEFGEPNESIGGYSEPSGVSSIKEITFTILGESKAKYAQPTRAKPLTIVIPPPFPSRFVKSKKEEQEKDILEIFRKVKVNIPLLDAIKQIPRYAKVLKELCTSKRKLRGDEKVHMGENVSTALQKKLPPKCNDPCMFTIPCKISSVRVKKAMLDLGASINVMSHSIYSSLNVGPLKDTGVIIQLADRSNAYPDGVLEDVLVQVNEFKIDVHKGTLTMEFDGEVIEFNMNYAIKYPNEEHSVFSVDVINPIVQEVFYKEKTKT
ncbi:uncharacterized protein LOC112100011 [Citrus clementina]|uniref:uncharacterized protein LOC112100011 n=1 Tax=Citrus clementina TaxID=85681 RepID=UPI000CED6B82|nr:uncharacterized protein LOC112100011 [Citrus x clementina]